MTRNDTDIAKAYHRETSHSYASVRTGGHYLDWTNKPPPFKTYLDAKKIPLPEPRAVSAISTLEALTIATAAKDDPTNISLDGIARLLFFSAGITKKKTYSDGTELFFRAASCTGALYEIELYLVCGSLPDLDAGVYHFDPLTFSLDILRMGDYRQIIADSTNREPHCSAAPLVVISTGTYWRNAWKYRARTYRHFGWDNGTIFANLLAMCRTFRWPASLILGYQDEPVNRLLGLNSEEEVSLALVPIGRGKADNSSPDPPVVRPLEFEVESPSEGRLDFPIMRTLHDATLLLSPDEVRAWSSQVLAKSQGQVEGSVRLPAVLDTAARAKPIERTILTRGSTRQFARVPVSLEDFTAVIRSAAEGIPADFLSSSADLLNDWYILVHEVDGAAPGAYVLNRSEWRLELLKTGSFRKEGSYLALEQSLGGDCSFDVFFLADLDQILDRLGNRGYRAVQLEAGVSGGRIYLAAYSLGLGATGLTFYDDAVADFFSPHAEGKSCIFLMAVGHAKMKKTV